MSGPPYELQSLPAIVNFSGGRSSLGGEGENLHMSTAEPNARPHTNRTGANFVGWGIMQSATEGPRKRAYPRGDRG